jgi:hypothetical protein
LPSEAPRSQLLPIGTPACACPRRHLLTGWPWRLLEASCTLGPALCTSPCSVTSSARPSASQSSSSAGGIRTHDLELMRLARTASPLPRKVWPAGLEPATPASEAGGMANFPTTSLKPPAGLEPAASGLRARRLHAIRPRGHEAPAAGLEPALSRVTVARLTDSTTPERRRRRQQDSNLRTARAVCAVATRCLASSAMPPRAEGEGIEPPRPVGPPVFETGYRTGGSPSEGGPGRRRTCNVPLKRRALCRLSYGATM